MRGSDVQLGWNLHDRQDDDRITSTFVTTLESSPSFLVHAIRKEGLPTNVLKNGLSGRLIVRLNVFGLKSNRT